MSNGWTADLPGREISNAVAVAWMTAGEPSGSFIVSLRDHFVLAAVLPSGLLVPRVRL